jgi:AAA domain
MKISNANSSAVPITLIYGAEGRGKTTLASKFPKPLALLLERRLPRGVSVDAVEDVGSFDAVMTALRDIYNDAGGYQTLVIDTVDALEALLLADLCRWKNIESPPYGKGFVIADDEWRRFLRAITTIRDKHNMTIVMTCHASVERVDDPRAPTYTAYAPRLHKRARGLVMDACDAVFFLSEDLHVVSEGEGFRERRRARSASSSVRDAQRSRPRIGSECRRNFRSHWTSTSATSPNTGPLQEE